MGMIKENLFYKQFLTKKMIKNSKRIFKHKTSLKFVHEDAH